MTTYIYKGDRFTDPALKNKQCKAARRHDGKCIRGKNGNMLVQFDGVLVNVIARLLRKVKLKMKKDIPWINVKERCPKNNKYVIVWDKKEGIKKDYYSRSNGDVGWMMSRQDHITHWIGISNFNHAVKPSKEQ